MGGMGGMRKISFALMLMVAGLAKAQLPNKLTTADKIYGLSKFWQEVNYNFVYLDKVNRKQWDSAYKAMITQVAATTNDYTYFRLMQRFCALLNDGHTNVYMPDYIGALQFTRMFGDYWLNLENINGKAIVTRTLKANLKELPIGTEVIEVNGIPVDSYLKDSVMPYIASSTEYVKYDFAVNDLLKGLIGDSYRVKFKRPDGTIFPVTLTHARTKDTAFYPAMPQHDLLELKWYANDIAYVALNGFGNRKIDTMFVQKLPELYKAKAVIIDLRNNGGGSTSVGTDILQYFTNDTVLQHSRYSTREHLASFKAWGLAVEPKDTLKSDWNRKAWKYYHDKGVYYFEYEPRPINITAQRIVVPTVLLFGHNTASAAEDFLISADNQKHMVKMGTRSFGSTGQPFEFGLPGGASARVCTKKDTYPDGREFVGYGVAPDIEVIPDVSDFIANRDKVLETAISYLQKKLTK